MGGGRGGGKGAYFSTTKIPRWKDSSVIRGLVYFAHIAVDRGPRVREMLSRASTRQHNSRIPVTGGGGGKV